LATALWSGVQAINAEARASYARAAATLMQDQLPALVAANGDAIQLSTYVALRRKGWRLSPVLEGKIRVGGRSFTLIGIDPLSAPKAPGATVTNDSGNLTAFLTPPGQLIVAPETAVRLAGENQIPPVVVSGDVAPGLLISDIGVAERLLDRKNELSRLIVLPDQPRRRASMADVAPQLREVAPQATNDISRLTDSFHLNLTAFGLLSFAVGLFIVHSTIGLAFEQRRGVFRTLRALGLSARALTTALVVELLCLAIVSGAAGVASGYLIAAFLLPDVAATLKGLYGAEVSGNLAFRPEWWATGLVIAVLGTVTAAASNLWHVWRLPILSPAQPRAWMLVSTRTIGTQGAVALGLFAIAILIGVFGSGLIAGFAILGGFLLGAALVLPPVLNIALSVGEKFARGPVSQWFWADTRQQLPGLSLALMALLLALSVNIGVGTMIASFRLTFTGWLDQRLASELYVTARSEEEAAQLRNWLLPRSDAVLPIRSVETRIAGAPGRIFGIADHPTYRENWPLISARTDVWDRVAAGDGVLINEQLARREGLALGDRLTLPWGIPMDVSGVYSDYGNPAGQVLVDINILAERYPGMPRLRHAIRVDPDKAPALADAIRTEFDLGPQNVVDQMTLKAFSMQVFERTFAVIGALNVLTLAVAGFAMLTSLLTLAAQRLPQLAPVWALGMTRKKLAQLELMRALLLASLTAVTALPVGLVLAWVLLAVVNVEAFGWRLPMHIFPADWARLWFLALLAAYLAAVLPARRLARISPADLVKIFAHER
ncbi:MAG: FtsX-like permease family protein, partial [Rhodobacteraceae bacterium]|nr:FtsX-like permease family protein [Paracoccaceae bacterium]